MDQETKDVLAKMWSDNKVCSIATIGEDAPWVATIYFAVEDDHLFCLVTHGTKTLDNMKKNPNVSFSIDNKEPVTFLQGRGVVEVEPGEDDFEKGKRLLLEKIPEIEGFMREPSFNIVKIVPKSIHLTDFTRGWFPARIIEP